VPLYEYQCTKCKRRTEKIESMNGPHLKKCPHCGAKVEQMLTAPAIQFKGTGWYVTDYAGKKSGGDATPAAGKSEGGDSKESGAKDSAGKDSKESKESKESKDSKEKKTGKKKD
jgi:putative FmdB family regulatory protein